MDNMHFKLSSGETLELSRGEIAESEDIDQLTQWYTQISEASVELSIHLKAQAEGGVGDPALGRKLGFFRYGEHIISKRLEDLGSPVYKSTAKGQRQAEEITRLLNRVADLTKIVQSYEAAAPQAL